MQNVLALAPAHAYNNISFARRPLPGVSAPLWGRGRAVEAPCPAPPSTGWGRAKAKADAPSRSAPHFPCLRLRPCQLMGVAPCAKAEVHKAIPAPARAFSPRQPAYGRALARLCAESLCAKAEVHKTILAAARALSPRQPAYGRITVCKGGVHKAKADAPSRSAPYFPRLRPSPCPPTAESLCAKAEVHKVIPALPVRSPRVSPPKTEPPPADGRSAVRPSRVSLSTAAPRPLMGEVPSAMGEGEGKGGRPLAQQPAPVRLPPRSRRLNGHPASAGGRENDRMAHRRTATPTHRTPRGNDTCTIRVPRRKGAQSVVHNL